METLEIISALETLLTEERAAIARLDGARVNVIAREKMVLATQLEGRPLPERHGATREIESLVRNLKNNGVLLAQARGILSDLLRGRGATLERDGRKSVTSALRSSAARHLSVRG